jgi:GNAT superfamily N-acetyltransferase
MAITIREAQKKEIRDLIPLLLLAEPSEPALQWSLSHMSDVVYRMEVDGQAIGAATVRWRDDPCEIIELAIAEGHQRQGYGKQLVAWIVEEARRRGKHRLEVGTANSSIDNIAFYQHCGFRMDHVRRDYFWYYRKPIVENGIVARDLLVFSYDLQEQDHG